MHTLKDMAIRMDCHPRTAKRWWKKLRVPPDVVGHGPHRWRDKSAEKLIRLYETAYSLAGTTPQIIRAKYAGLFTDEKQLKFNFDAKPKTIPQQQRQSLQASSRRAKG